MRRPKRRTHQRELPAIFLVLSASTPSAEHRVLHSEYSRWNEQTARVARGLSARAGARMMAAGIGGRLLPEIYEEPAAHGNAVQQEANRIAKVRQGAISHWATDKRVHCRDGCNTSSALQAHAQDRPGAEIDAGRPHQDRRTNRCRNGGKGLSQADTYLLACTIPRCLLTID